jgi:hypothetical protein
VIFTSPRAFGNQVNPKSYASATYGTATHFTCAAPMLWVGALDDVAANGSDRSHPAFWLPGQYSALPTATYDYINERGYLVPSPCKASGVTCSNDDECCGSDATPVTAACRAPSGWTPAAGAPAKTCEALSGTCGNSGDSCATAADCCNGAACVNFACAAPGAFETATFTREYVADCPVGYRPDWQLFNYHTTLENGSKLQISVQTSQDLDDLDTATIVSLGDVTTTVVSPASPGYKDVGGTLAAAGASRHLQNLRVMITLVPSVDLSKAPVLHDWEQRYTCEPAE